MVASSGLGLRGLTPTLGALSTTCGPPNQTWPWFGREKPDLLAKTGANCAVEGRPLGPAFFAPRPPPPSAFLPSSNHGPVRKQSTAQLGLGLL